MKAGSGLKRIALLATPLWGGWVPASATSYTQQNPAYMRIVAETVVASRLDSIDGRLDSIKSQADCSSYYGESLVQPMRHNAGDIPARATMAGFGLGRVTESAC